jgi:hypothetical protein
VFLRPFSKRHQGEAFINHFKRKAKAYGRYGFHRIHAVPFRPGANNVVDYSMKSIKNVKVDYDSTIILPRTYAERFEGGVRQLDGAKRALRDLQAARNFSDELATQVLADTGASAQEASSH